jgi:hypothetical protein
MTRRRYIQDPVTYELIPADEYHGRASAGPFIQGDIEPYRSMVTGEMVMGRRQHREHLRTHNVIEVGNELDRATPKSCEPPRGLKEHVIRAAHQHLR